MAEIDKTVIHHIDACSLIGVSRHLSKQEQALAMWLREACCQL
jgi:hypothetical protein